MVGGGQCTTHNNNNENINFNGMNKKHDMLWTDQNCFILSNVIHFILKVEVEEEERGRGI